MKLLFVCHGNICRSVMAEFILKDLIKKYQIKDLYVESMALTREEIGNTIYYKAKETLLNHNITIYNHYATLYLPSHYESFDHIYYMDKENLYYLEYIKKDIQDKYRSLQNYEIEDPWYTRNFEKVYEEIYDGILNILYEFNFLKKER